tara:strand:+ start:5947 stop:8298 length:2352 start_codon:yes stop_codon:yes gene_type:complete
MTDRAYDNTGTGYPRLPVPAAAPEGFPKLGKPDARYVYVDEEGKGVCVVYRYDKSDNSDDRPRKTFRPYDLERSAWCGPVVRPLYRLDLIRATAAEDDPPPVVMVEGEKCADALNDLGILASTVFGGCNGVARADLSPLKGRAVIIWPDIDAPGFKFADQLAERLNVTGAASVWVLPMSEAFLRNVTGRAALTLTYTLRKGWDAADAIAGGWGVDELQCLLRHATGIDALAKAKGAASAESFKGNDPFKGDYPLKGPDAFKGDSGLKDPANDDGPHPLKLKGMERRAIDLFPDAAPEAEGAVWGEPDMSVLNPRRRPPAFPASLFGPFWSGWITRHAEGKSAPVDYVGVTLLVTASALIGNAVRVSPWESWQEPAHLWAALVGSPSSGKSPAMEPVLDLIGDLEAEGADAFKDRKAAYEADALAAKCAREDWEKAVRASVKDGRQPPAMPDAAREPLRPERPRIRIGDATTEAIVTVLAVQPKGVLMMRDELAGWLGGFNRYSGGEGGDRAFWLEAWGGRSHVIDRVKNGEPLIIPHLSVAVLGSTQPDRLASTLLKGDDDGLTARFLFVWPDTVPLERPKGIPQGAEARNALKALHGLQMASDVHGNPVPRVVSLTEEAADVFAVWWKAQREEEPDGPLASWWGKMPGVCLRLAATFQGLWNAVQAAPVSQVERAAVEAATVMIDDYFKPMAARAYGDAALSPADRNAAALAKWLQRTKPDRINLRDLQRGGGNPAFKDREALRDAVDILVEAEWLRPAPSRTGGTKGRQKVDYVVNPAIIA